MSSIELDGHHDTLNDSSCDNSLNNSTVLQTRPDISHPPESSTNSDLKQVSFSNLASLQTSSNELSDGEEDTRRREIKTARLSHLKKISSYPYHENMSKTKSVDSQLSDSSTLPEFNKRPLTDTPIVSYATTPDMIDDEEQEKEEEDRIKHLKNISHLNLLELKTPSSNSLSPTTSAQQKDKEKDKAVEPRYELGPPASMDRTDSAASAVLPTTSDLPVEPTEDTFDLPDHLKKKFEKTASLEKIKTLLNTKPKQKKAYTLNIPGQTSSKISPDGRIASVDVGSKLVIVMVGLPARGKSYITNKLTRYLNWLQHDCRVFNVGNTRRLDIANNNGPEDKPLPDTHTPNNELASPSSPTNHNADFFSPDNYTYTALREKWAMDTLDQLLDYVLNGNGSVGIFDATNSTKKRRSRVLKRIQERTNGELKVLFLESICTDPSLIENNIRLKLSGPDYKNMDPEIALKDFVGRLKNYEKAYETIDEQEEKIPNFQYVKMIDVGKKVVSYNVQGFLASQTIYFLLNFNLCERQIWITRHGESVDNLSGRIGGDSKLTKRGHKFSKTLAKFMNFQRQEFRKNQLKQFSDRLELKYSDIVGNGEEEDPLNQIPTEPNFCVWTSMLTRAIESGQYFDDLIYSIKEMRMLNELGGGKFEGLTYEEIQTKYPKEYEARVQNKLTYRYPGVGGESYLDVLTRLRPLITEVERTTDHLLIISHRVVLRILLAYFLNLDRSAIGELDVPLHTLYCLESKPYGTDYRMYEYDEALDWFVKVEPEHQKNVKEVGVVFKQRKYSVIPTAPPTSRKPDVVRKRGTARMSLRRSASQGFNNTPK